MLNHDPFLVVLGFPFKTRFSLSFNAGLARPRAFGIKLLSWSHSRQPVPCVLDFSTVYPKVFVQDSCRNPALRVCLRLTEAACCCTPLAVQFPGFPVWFGSVRPSHLKLPAPRPDDVHCPSDRLSALHSNCDAGGALTRNQHSSRLLPHLRVCPHQSVLSWRSPRSPRLRSAHALIMRRYYANRFPLICTICT